MNALWNELLSTEEQVALPWLGGRALHGRGRAFRLAGARPPEHGWHTFTIDGSRKASWSGQEAWPDLEALMGQQAVTGYLVGDRVVPDGATVDPDPRQLIEASEQVHLVEPGLERFARVRAARWEGGPLVYVQQEFPLGPEYAVREAFVDKRPSVVAIPEVTPALDLAFRFESWQRQLAEERRVMLQLRAEERERELLRAAEEQELQRMLADERREALQMTGTGAGRRRMVKHDFRAAAEAALAVSGAELLDVRGAHKRGERVVQFRFNQRRFECVVQSDTLRIVDSGICLIDHGTGEKGDTYFTLESLPAVIQQAMNEGRLVVFRHVR